MDKIRLLQERKAKIAAAGKAVRERIKELADEDSFVELSAFSFSKNEFFDEAIAGEGVVTGFCTVSDYPFYLVAQNFEAFNGGISKANCDKIVKCLDAAEKNATPVIYLLNTHGVQIGEGVTVLEGLGKLLLRSAQLKGVVPQYVIVDGEVYGSAALIAAAADVTFFLKKKSVLAINSPLVLSAKAGKNLTKEEVGGLQALDKAGISSVEAENLAAVKAKLGEISELLEKPVIDAELNAPVTVLNQSSDKILSIFESSIEIGAAFDPEVKTLIARIGGIAVSAVVFAGGEKGVALTASRLSKVRRFAEFACCYHLPFLVFSDTLGIEATMSENNGFAMKEAAEYLSMLDTIDTPKIAVVYKKAIGLGYSLFASKSVGFDYTCAFAGAKIALFDSVQGAKIELAGEKADEAKLEEKYADENSDPINAAKDGYIDAVIEPQFVKQYLISALEMLGC